MYSYATSTVCRNEKISLIVCVCPTLSSFPIIILLIFIHENTEHYCNLMTSSKLFVLKCSANSFRKTKLDGFQYLIKVLYNQETQTQTWLLWCLWLISQLQRRLTTDRRLYIKALSCILQISFLTSLQSIRLHSTRWAIRCSTQLTPWMVSWNEFWEKLWNDLGKRIQPFWNFQINSKIDFPGKLSEALTK